MRLSDNPSGPLFLADNLALDFINSEYGTGEQRYDCFSDDQSVADWLTMAGVWPDNASSHIPDELEAQARALRD